MNRTYSIMVVILAAIVLAGLQSASARAEEEPKGYGVRNRQLYNLETGKVEGIVYGKHVYTGNELKGTITGRGVYTPGQEQPTATGIIHRNYDAEERARRQNQPSASAGQKQTCNDAECYSKLADKLTKSNAPQDEIIAVLNEAISKFPYVCKLHVQLGDFYKSQSMRQQTLDTFKKASQVADHMSLADKETCLYCLGVSYFNDGDYKNAIETFRQVVSLNNNSSEYARDANAWIDGLTKKQAKKDAEAEQKAAEQKTFKPTINASKQR